MRQSLYFAAAVFILTMLDQVNPKLAMTTLSLVILLTNRSKYFSLYYNN